VHLTDDQRRERAGQAILEAFAERPMKLIEGEVLKAATQDSEEPQDPRYAECSAQIEHFCGFYAVGGGRPDTRNADS